MEYGDETIITAMNQYKAGERGDIYKGVYIKEDLYEFERQVFFDGKMSIMLPKIFTDMSLADAQIKYPSQQRPEIIKTNELGSINFAFSYLDVDISTDGITDLRDSMRNLIKKVQPANVFFSRREEKVEDTIVGWFDFKSHGIDEKLYQIMYCTPIDGKVLHGIFNCIFTDYQYWKPVVIEVMQSIRDMTKDVV